jgi:hypothetical protein
MAPNLDHGHIRQFFGGQFEIQAQVLWRSDKSLRGLEHSGKVD